ncbi:MAG: hypothetical protein M3N53_09765 [Actinomycetota bacterium]|nr:hypothetical protein [Actinomycetota bacterium]
MPVRKHHLLRLLLVLCVALLLIDPLTREARAHLPGSEAVLGDGAQLLPNGLYQVTLGDGYTMTTHGGDLLREEALVNPLAPGAAERPPICATGNVQHVLYGHPDVISRNRVEDVKEQIRTHIRQMNALLNAAAMESGGVTADYRVACDANGEIRVDSFVNPTLIPYFTTVVAAARDAGFSDPDVDYSIFYDGEFPGICGIAELWRDSRPSADNRNNSGGYAVTYESCWFSRTAMHENGHNQGAVQAGAPNHDGTNHCTEQLDVMCYPSTSRACPTSMLYDCGYDTYFDAKPEAGEWLDSHWNIGSRVNRYIVFGDAVAPARQPDPIPPPEPEPSPTASADSEDPGARLAVSSTRPRRGARFRAVMTLDDCEGHQGTTIALQRRVNGEMATIAEAELDADCQAVTALRASFRSATFRSFWAQQDDDHTEAASGLVTVRSRR